GQGVRPRWGPRVRPVPGGSGGGRGAGRAPPRAARGAGRRPGAPGPRPARGGRARARQPDAADPGGGRHIRDARRNLRSAAGRVRRPPPVRLVLRTRVALVTLALGLVATPARAGL